jgi:hypothetical protein
MWIFVRDSFSLILEAGMMRWSALHLFLATLMAFSLVSTPADAKGDNDPAELSDVPAATEAALGGPPSKLASCLQEAMTLASDVAAYAGSSSGGGASLVSMSSGRSYYRRRY